jgi:hypothetical protein
MKKRTTKILFAVHFISWRTTNIFLPLAVTSRYKQVKVHDKVFLIYVLLSPKFNIPSKQILLTLKFKFAWKVTIKFEFEFKFFISNKQ